MKSEYYPISNDEDCCYFEFTSRSEFKEYRKVVIYDPLEDGFERYNLCLAQILPNGRLCDLTVSNNGDLDKIISTVIRTMFLFFSKNPSKSIFFTGSTPIRTRLYRMIIAREFLEAEKYFEIYGVAGGNPEPFKPNADYDGFVIKLKHTSNEDN